MTAKVQPWLNQTRALTIYAAIFSTFIAWASWRTVADPAPHGVGVQCLAAVEIVGALLFAFRKTRALGLIILLVVFAIASAIELHLHEVPLRFVFYAASALLAHYLSVHLRDDQNQTGALG